MFSSLTAGKFLMKYKPNLTYPNLTYNADYSRYCNFCFNQKVTKDRMYVNQCI